MVRGFKGNRRAASEAGITHCCPCTKPQSFPAGKVTAKQVPALFKYPRVETDLEMIPMFIPHNLFLLVLFLGVKHPSIPGITAKDFPPSTNPFSVDLEQGGQPGFFNTCEPERGKTTAGSRWGMPLQQRGLPEAEVGIYWLGILP